MFNPDTGGWTEENAHIDFNFETYSDQDLIQELEKRGYEVKKKVAA